MPSRNLIALVPFLSLLGACSATGDPKGTGGAGGGGAGGSGSGVTCPPDPNYMGGMPMVSLKNDLLSDITTDKPAGGVFRRACAASSCHDPSNPIAGLFIAPPARDSMTQDPLLIMPDQIDRFLNGTDGVKRASTTAPSIQIVKPNEPWNSFLMRKLDGCWTGIETQCTPIPPSDPPCGESMPASAGELLAPAERDLVRRWIFQGAQNN